MVDIWTILVESAITHDIGTVDCPFYAFFLAVIHFFDKHSCFSFIAFFFKSCVIFTNCSETSFGSSSIMTSLSILQIHNVKLSKKIPFYKKILPEGYCIVVNIDATLMHVIRTWPKLNNKMCIFCTEVRHTSSWLFISDNEFNTENLSEYFF